MVFWGGQGKGLSAHLLMLLLFFFEPKSPCMKMMAPGALLEEGLAGSWRS